MGTRQWRGGNYEEIINEGDPIWFASLLVYSITWAHQVGRNNFRGCIGPALLELTSD